MSTRFFGDWLSAFVDYAKFSEAPKHMHFWTGVSTVAGALRRKVWIDQAYFKWYANQYVILVAPPGIVSKSTTANIGMRLLRNVPGIKFGPDVVTWQALVTAFSEAAETFENVDFTTGEIQHLVMSPITIESSEFGNLLNPQDKDMVDLLVSLWDGKQGGFEKKTKHSGNDTVQNPWINMIACTTPSWIAGNFPEYMIGGGFTSRCLFVYADKKAQYVAYPGLKVPKDMQETANRLTHDLECIATEIQGEYRLSDKAVAWGEQWYEAHYKIKPVQLDDDRFGGYIARKQTHLHKLAMVLAASQGNNMTLEAEHLAVADKMLSDLETDMSEVFGKIGRTEISLHADRLISYIRRRGECPYVEAYRYIHAHFPSISDFEDILAGCIRAGYVTNYQKGGTMYLGDPKAPPTQ